MSVFHHATWRTVCTLREMNSFYQMVWHVVALVHCGSATLHVSDTWPLDTPIIPREGWKARSPVALPEPILPAYFPVPYIFIHHSGNNSQCSYRPCCQIVKAYQDHDMKVNNFNDIGYHFLVDPEGLIYEGRGWGKVGAHALGYNTKSIGICFIGNFNEVEPTEEALLATTTLIQYGTQLGQISENYILYAHKHIKNSDNNLYRIILTWSHYRNNI